jgi:hypothetical protein
MSTSHWLLSGASPNYTELNSVMLGIVIDPEYGIMINSISYKIRYITRTGFRNNECSAEFTHNALPNITLLYNLNPLVDVFIQKHISADSVWAKSTNTLKELIFEVIDHAMAAANNLRQDSWNISEGALLVWDGRRQCMRQT